MGHLYSHRRQPMGRFSNVVLGTRSFTEGNIEGHRETTIFFIEGSLLKHPIFEGHDCVSEATSEVTQEVHL